MNRYNNLYLIGSSHISKQSIKEITDAFDSVKPGIAAVELDKQRAYALMSEKQGKPSIYDMKRVGAKGFIFALLGSWASKKLGKVVGVSPGSEMKTVITLAKERDIPVALIDQDIEVTLKKFSKSLTWKEKRHFLADMFNGLVLRKKDPLLKEFDLNKVPEQKVIKKMIGQLRVRYPNIYKVIIEERNYYMARKLKKLMLEHPDKNILAVVGAGHEEDILAILKDNEGVSYSFSVG